MKRDTSRAQGPFIIYAAMVAAMVFWAFSFIWTKMVLVHYRPFTILLVRLVLSVLVMAVLDRWLRRIQRIERAHLKHILLLSFLQPFVYFVGETYALDYVSSTVAAVCVATIPLFAPSVSYLFFGERVRPFNFAGIVISIAGVVMVVLRDDAAWAASLTGFLFLLLAVVTALAYSVLLIRLPGNYNVYSIIYYQNLVGIGWFLIAFLCFDLGHARAAGIHWEALPPLLALAVFASSLAFVFFTHGIRKLGITKANACTNIIPVFTAIFAFLLLGERFSLLNIAGMLLVIVGLFMSQMGHALLATGKNFFFRQRP